MPRPLSRLAATLVLAALLALPATADARTVKLSFVLLCDIYEMDPVMGRGGLARVATAVREERERAQAAGSQIFVAHAGDAISPSLMSGFDQGAHMIDLLNGIGLDAFVPGNHEFDFGPQIFRERMGEARFPLLAANLRDEAGQPLAGFADRRLLDMDGVKVGIIGLADQDTRAKSEPGALQFAGTLDTAVRMSEQLRSEGADLVVAVAHAERTLDMQLVKSGAIDLLLSGDDHDLVVYYDGSAAYIESKQEGEYVTVADLSITIDDKDGKRRVAWWPDFRVIDTAGLAPDPAMEARIKDYRAELTAELDVPLGTMATALDSRSASMRSGEAAMGNLVADAMRDATGADVTVTNGGGIRGNKLYPAGHVMTRRDILIELPFRNLTVVYELTGAQLRAVLENGLATAEAASGRFPQVSGLHVVADLARPAGSRIVELLVNGEPIGETRRYRVATNDFMASGHEGYDMFRDARVLVGPADARMMSNDVMAFIRKHQPLAPAIEGRIVMRR